MKKSINIKGQIWVETVIYTMIALVMIGAVLAFITPRIAEIQDRAIIEQTITSMGDIDSVVLSVSQNAGNRRTINFYMKKGKLEIDGVNNEITFEMQSRYVFSQPGEEVNINDLTAKTEKSGSENIVTLTKKYDYEITYQGNDEIKEINQASTPYKISVENKGKNSDGKVVMDISIS
mgnify:FL=1